MQHNKTNDPFSMIKFYDQVCEASLESSEGPTDILLVQSILCDFVGGIISFAYLCQFYQGIEISHPIFAVLFSNIVFSTIISFATFGIVLLWNIGTITCIIMLDLVECAYFMAIFMYSLSWLVIASLRHHLMFKEEDDTIDLSMLRRKALSFIWGTFSGIMVIRMVFSIFDHLGIEIFPLNAILMLSLLIFFVVSFYVISYRTDSMMNKKVQNANDMQKQVLNDKNITTDRQPTKRCRANTTPKPTNNSKTQSFEMLQVNALENRSFDFSDDSMSVLEKVFPKRNEESNEGPFLQLEGKNDYGGIYVGDNGENNPDNHLQGRSNEASSSTVTNEERPRKEKNKNRKIHRANIRYIEPDVSISHLQSSANNCDHFQVLHSSNNVDNVSLPNQVPNDTTSHPSNQHCLETANDLLNHRILESASINVVSNLGAIATKSPRTDQKRSTTNNEELNRIEVLNESSTNSSTESNIPEYSHNFLEEMFASDDRNSNLETLYRDTKEHKSIMKTVIFNAVCMCLTVTMCVVVVSISRYPNAYVLITFSALLKFQRTFQSIIASIYCFEVVNQLIKANVWNMKNNLEEICGRLQNMC